MYSMNAYNELCVLKMIKAVGAYSSPNNLRVKIALSANQATNSLEGSTDKYLEASSSYYGYTPPEFSAIVSQTGTIPLKKQ